MKDNFNDGQFISMQSVSNRSPHDIRQYWTPERKRAAVPAPMGVTTEAPKMPEAENAEPATDPKQADLSKMPFTAGGKLFFTALLKKLVTDYEKTCKYKENWRIDIDENIKKAYFNQT